MFYVFGWVFDGLDFEGGVREDNYFCSFCGGWFVRWCWWCGSNFIGSIIECYFIVLSFFVVN